MSTRPSELIDLLCYRYALNHALEADLAAHFVDNRMGVRVPGGDNTSPGDDIAVVDCQFRAIGDAITFAIDAMLIVNDQLGGTGNYDITAVAALNPPDARKCNCPVVPDFNTTNRCCP